MSKPILVTGATGTVGRALIHSLQAAGAEVLAGSTSGRAVDGAPGRVVNFEQAGTLDAAFTESGSVFLLFPLQPNKLELAQNAVAAAQRSGVRHLVRSSGAGADPQSSHAIGKLQGEIDALVTTSGVPFTLLRPNSFMQNWVNYYGAMVRAGTVYLANADGRSAWIDARDIADAAAQVLLHPAGHEGQAYELTGPEALNAAEILDIVRTETGVAARYQPVTFVQAGDSLRQAGMTPWSVDIMTSLARLIAAGDTAQISPDLGRLIGKAPRDFRSFVRDHAAAWN